MCVQYVVGCSVHRGEGGGVHCIGGYHEYIGGISRVHWEMFSTSEGYYEYIGGDIMSTLGEIS